MKAKRGMKSGTNNPGSRGAGPSFRSASGGGLAEWKEGELFPEGWDEMDPLQKAAELYLGKRGFLFWSTKLALGGVIFLAVAWIVFRFIGPAVGLYTLTNDLSTPNL
jgi:hypothetical protein